jgi:type II secretory pathway pseudopilin PulG
VARSDPSARSTRRLAQAGLTITELLIYLLLAGVLAAAAASLVVSHVRTSRNLELRQRAVDLYGRINHLLQLEISEGSTISYNQPLPEDCRPGTPLFRVSIPSPFPSEEGEATSESTSIHYFSRNNGNELWRCGPSFNRVGGLFALNADGEETGVPNSVFPALVNTNTQLRPCENPDECDSRAIRYRMIFFSPDGQQVVFQAGAEQPLIARTGVQEIEPIGAVEQDLE